MKIIEAIDDRRLMRPFLQDKAGDMSSWSNWATALKVLYGLPVKKAERQRIHACTGRSADLLPKSGFDVSLFLIGRRSGKSRVAAVVASYEAALSGKEKALAPGEVGVVTLIAPTKLQAGIVKSYVRAIFTAPLLEQEIVREDRDGFELSNGVRIMILAGDWRSVRGFTLLAVVCDELAFFPYSEESKVRSDSELVRALLPGLATAKGRLVAISSPYARKGWCYRTHKRHFGNDRGSVLVWNCPSRTMNPLLPQTVVDQALAEDLQAARSEYLGEFRDDVAAFLPREVIESVVVPGRRELLPRRGVTYTAFADLSGGRSDSASLAIAHKDTESKKVVLDCVREFSPPFDPARAIEDFSKTLHKYGVRRCFGDSYAGDFVSRQFARYGVTYVKADKSKSAIYLEMLPLLCSQDVELLDHEKMVVQFANLQRRTRSGGHDVVDHLPQCRDDLANAASGASVYCGRPGAWVGVIQTGPPTRILLDRLLTLKGSTR